MTHDPNYLPSDVDPVYTSDKMEPIDYHDHQRPRDERVQNNAERLLDAFKTIRDNYDQLNHDDEREAIEEALEQIEDTVAFDFRDVAEATLPQSRIRKLLQCGRIVSIDVDQRMEYAGGLGAGGIDDVGDYVYEYDINLRVREER